ncbi:DUF3780 domain-containing protein [Exiguobacterium sp. RIT452]|uniref:anti-phage-associated DUF3780 domain-containing protein n=1 Tax=Exiguobacterium sp. RIT452 TaxID=2315552 RepID=UPI000E712609|nr:anti-phage-associated DUF3780 domain-containing protein [Exiguobacterium sp. RIT452]RJO96338.1 DUF3780 domain-containing protein [Exiguobacterium sp. RIT452]
MNKTIDFGAPSEFGMHHFYVEIPVAPRDAIYIYEDFGFDGDEFRRETVECRLVLARELWTKIRDDARRDFNARLKNKRQSTGSWITGKIKLDRFLGRELCVLGWAAEHASPEECSVICEKWLALRPEERWWLYSKTASEAGLDNQSKRGWRKALYCALSDGANIKLEPKKKPKMNEKKLNQEETVSLFDFIDKGDM